MNSKVAFGWLVFYALFTIYQYLVNGLLLFDYLVYICILSIIVYFARNANLPDSSIWFFGLSTLAHVLGTVPFVWGGQEISLYHDAVFAGQYDLFAHFYGFLMLTFGILCLYTKLYAKSRRVPFQVFILLFFAVLGAGTIVEMTEYSGYRLFGFGWGMFQFGEGDNSENFGPWGDSMTDTFANAAGTIVAMLLYALWQKRDRIYTKRVSKSGAGS